MQRTLKDSNLKVRALRTARELREVFASLRPLTKVSRRLFFCKITHKSSAKSIEIWYNKSIEKPHKKRDFNA